MFHNYLCQMSDVNLFYFVSDIIWKGERCIVYYVPSSSFQLPALLWNMEHGSRRTEKEVFCVDCVRRYCAVYRVTCYQYRYLL